MAKIYGDAGYLNELVNNPLDVNIPFSKYLKRSSPDEILGFEPVELSNGISVFKAKKDGKIHAHVYYWDGLGNYNENNFIDVIYKNLVPDNTKEKIVLTKVRGNRNDYLWIPVIEQIK